MLSRTFTLGRYTCVERIGQSPLGEQWRAKRFGLSGLERQAIVLKFHSQLVPNAPAVTKLQTLLKAIAEVEHDGLLRLLEHGTQGSDQFAAFEFVGYADLRKVKAGLDLTSSSGSSPALLPSLVVYVGVQLCGALRRGHEKGLFHGLVSPESVWIDAQGGLHLANLGLSALLPPAAYATDPAVKALSAYSAPELENTKPSASSDLYSLGMVLQELLGSSAGRPSAPEAAPLLAALAPILSKATSKSPLERYRTAAELETALDGIQLPMQSAVRSALSQIGQQFEMLGDSVPQPVVISERSSAEPLPPPPTGRIVGLKPGLSGAILTGKPLASGQVSFQPLAKSGNWEAARPAKEPAAAASQRISKSERDEDTPLPMSRPLLMTNPKIPLQPPGRPQPDTIDPTADASRESSRARAASDENLARSASNRAKTGLDWLTANDVPADLPADGKRAGRADVGAGAARAGAPKRRSNPELPIATVIERGAPAESPSWRTTTPGVGGRLTPEQLGASAQPSISAIDSDPFSSSITPTGSQSAQLAQAAKAQRNEAQRQPQEYPVPPSAAELTPERYAPLVTSSPAELDELSAGQTSPALTPVKSPPPRYAQTAAAVADEATNQIDAAEALAIARAEQAAAAATRAQQQAPTTPNGTPKVGITDAGASTTEAGLGDNANPISSPAVGDSGQLTGAPSKRNTLLLVGLGLVGFVIASAATYHFTQDGPAGTGDPAKVRADGGSPADGMTESQATAAKAAAAGELKLTSTPEAEVYVDGEAKGKTPTTLKLGSGPHKLLLLAEQYLPLRKEVTAGAPLTISLERAKLPPDVAGDQALKITCKTKDQLRILIDGFDTGRTCPSDDISVEPGKHNFGFLRPVTDELHEKPFKVKAGKKPFKVKVKF